ncbi:TRAP transporter substrate-binding protein [Roseomonas indoligenes]|uniref:TRAP transporter substrate-binding protein n=1 Tax=Roseomonas indoligenes TaxID=2820811 RepID=A0A940N5E0_9PROT|nr:TRAP transporter substrate-binding protein [Pararoseomonas indoligenes]MBP0496291.1 TRAP transporter substrate-binding protein [Pararoseomonas indoligenes]
MIRSTTPRAQRAGFLPRAVMASLAALLAAAGPAAAQMPDSLAAGPAVRMSAVTQPLPTMPQYTRVDVPYLRDMLAQRTNNRLTMQLSSHAERNLGGNEIVRLVRSGQADIGAGTLSTLSGDVPILDGIDLAGLSPDIEQAKKIADAILPAANRDLERFGVRLMVIYPFPAQVLFCRQPFTTLSDLRGRKIRTFGNSLNDLISTIGAQPVSIGFPEVYSALERGVADCAVTGTGSGAAARWPEVSTHISDLPLSWSLAGYMVNLAWWNRLDPAVRTFMEGTFREMNDKLWDLGRIATDDGIACDTGVAADCKLHPLAARPMTLVRATQADRELVTNTFRTTILPNWVGRCGARCGEVYNQMVAPIGGVEYRR